MRASPRAAVAAEVLAPRVALPIHADGYEVGGAYVPTAGATERFGDEASKRGMCVRIPSLSEPFELVS